MRNVLLASAALLGLGFAGQAMASDSVAIIDQSAYSGAATQDVTGDHNNATISQTGGTYSLSYSATQTQNGNGNTASTTQRNGVGLIGDTAQVGDRNSITLTQSSGSRTAPNGASLSQTGNGNIATAVQTGTGDTLTTNVVGSGNTTTQNQQAHNSTMSVSVFGGDQNKITQTQRGGTMGVAGSGNTMVAITYTGAHNNTVTQRQDTFATGNTARAEVFGSFNTASIQQSGSNSIALQQQSGAGDRASITQGVGTANVATQRQY